MIHDGIRTAHVGGINAVDALAWYVMPTAAELEEFMYDSDRDIATFRDLTTLRSDLSGERVPFDDDDVVVSAR